LVGRERGDVVVNKLTPVLFVKEIEPVLPLWVDGLGFAKTIKVPEGDHLGFVILEKDGIEVMYQTYASVEKDLPAVLDDVKRGPTFLYVQVDSLEKAKAAAKGLTVYLPERTTFYGAKEIGVKDAAGHFITFAEFPQATK
jgi:uncharacterized glyoxalase superfamily protein PhnB